MSDMKCPYCDNEIKLSNCYEHADQDVKHQTECSNCGKVFVFYTSIIFYYEPYKADCLNDSPHDYKPTRTYPSSFTKMRCSMCDDERDLTAEEWESMKT